MTSRETAAMAGYARLAALSGAIAVGLLVVAFALTGFLGYRPRGAEATAIFTEASDRIAAAELIGGFYSLIFLLIFVGVVSAAIARHRGHAWLAAIALTGGITATVALAVGYRVLNAAAFVASGPAGISGELATFSFRLFASSFAGFVSFGLAALLGATGMSALRTRMLPRGLAWVGVICAVVLMTPAHGIAEGVALLWIVAVSVVLARRPPVDAEEGGLPGRVEHGSA